MDYFISPRLSAYDFEPIAIPKKSKKSRFIPCMSAYAFEPFKTPKKLKRRAKFAPQLLADGLTSGIVDKQGNLVHGAFDEGTEIDPFVNIQSDKFDIMQKGLDAVSVDPTPSSTGDGGNPGDGGSSGVE